MSYWFTPLSSVSVSVKPPCLPTEMPALFSASQPSWRMGTGAVGLSHMLSSVSQSANARMDSRQWRDGKNTNSVQSQSPDSVISFLYNLAQVTKGPQALVFTWQFKKMISHVVWESRGIMYMKSVSKRKVTYKWKLSGKFFILWSADWVMQGSGNVSTKPVT